ncbi:uncharacterized protein LOC118435593 [Folsomia candida]|nr:uncharacterized protein LOC118435593 [Folsomia candida]
MNFAAFNGFKAVQRYNRGTLADEIFGRAGIKIVTTSAAAELDVEGVQIIASGKTSRTVIGTVKSGAPNSIREPSLLAIDNFFFRGGVELNHQLYFFHSFTKFPPLDQVIQILTKETDFKLLELKMSDAYQNVSQNMIVLRGLSENNNKGMLGKEHFLELSGITMLGGVNLH